MPAYSLESGGLQRDSGNYIPKDPSIQIIPTLGPNVCKYYCLLYLLLAIGIQRIWLPILFCYARGMEASYSELAATRDWADFGSKMPEL